jgi:hypothetical protein
MAIGGVGMSSTQDLYDQLHREFRFTAHGDSLDKEWSGTCWTFPPYGREIGAWLRKARLSAEAGATVVCLVPARTDTKWWWDNCLFGEIRILRGRLKFASEESSAPFPSAVVIFGRKPKTVFWERP